MKHLWKFSAILLLAISCASDSDDDQDGDAAGGDPVMGDTNSPGDTLAGDPAVGDSLTGDTGGDSNSGDSNSGDTAPGDTTGNQTPVLSPIGDRTVTVGQNLSFTLNATDPEGHGLSFSTDGAVGPGGDPYTAATPAMFASGTGQFSWTPTAAEIGSYNAAFTVTDDGTPPRFDSETIAIDVVANQAPALDAIEDQTAFVGIEVMFTVMATDPEGHTITLSTDGTVGPGGDPYLEGTPAVFTAGTGVFAWTPTGAEVGSYTVRFIATDDGTPQAMSSIDVSIDVVANQAPTLAAIGDKTAQVGELLSFTLSANDPENGTLTYSTDGAVGPDANPYTAATPATFTPGTATFAWTPTATEAGDYSVEFTVTDDGAPNESDSETITITVPAPGDGMLLLNEVAYNPTGAQFVEIINADTSPIDVAGWRLCGASFKYWTLPGTEVIMQPNDVILVHWNQSGVDIAGTEYYTGLVGAMGTATGGTAKSMALYHSQGGFGSSTAIRDYVQWIDGGQAREDVADPEIWTAGTSVGDTGANASICYNGGDSTTVGGYAVDPSPTPGRRTGAATDRTAFPASG